jgi:hypothetical protein
MGCCCSAEKGTDIDHPRPAQRPEASPLPSAPSHPYYGSLNNDSIHYYDITTQSNTSLLSMGGPTTSRLATQHERLMLELLPFKDNAQFQEWLQSPYVRGSWTEFGRDYLSRRAAVPGPEAQEPDKEATAREAKQAIDGRVPRFMVFHPDKQGWTAQDHTVRFIAAVVSDSMLHKVWSSSDWKKRDMQICKAVYEVLSFLRSTLDDEQHQLPPSYNP